MSSSSSIIIEIPHQHPPRVWTAKDRQDLAEAAREWINCDLDSVWLLAGPEDVARFLSTHDDPQVRLAHQMVKAEARRLGWLRHSTQI